MTRNDPRLGHVRPLIASELRRLRIAAGLTQRDVEYTSGVHRPIIGRIERGLHASSIQTCTLIAEACGGSLWDVLRVLDKFLGLVPSKAIKRPSARVPA